jgi:hypothetical protein
LPPIPKDRARLSGGVESDLILNLDLLGLEPPEIDQGDLSADRSVPLKAISALSDDDADFLLDFSSSSLEFVPKDGLARTATTRRQSVAANNQWLYPALNYSGTITYLLIPESTAEIDVGDLPKLPFSVQCPGGLNVAITAVDYLDSGESSATFRFTLSPSYQRQILAAAIMWSGIFVLTTELSRRHWPRLVFPFGVVSASALVFWVEPHVVRGTKFNVMSMTLYAIALVLLSRAILMPAKSGIGSKKTSKPEADGGCDRAPG